MIGCVIGVCGFYNELFDGMILLVCWCSGWCVYFDLDLLLLFFCWYEYVVMVEELVCRILGVVEVYVEGLLGWLVVEFEFDVDSDIVVDEVCDVVFVVVVDIFLVGLVLLLNLVLFVDLGNFLVILVLLIVVVMDLVVMGVMVIGWVV